ncbi:MAG: TSUP family transporter, partial [Novosphingobium sp.]
MPELWIVVALALTGVVTGFIDAVAGGGGLIMMPALLSAGLPPHVALGTNKLQSMMGTTTAANTFWRHGLFKVRTDLGTVAVVFAGAAGGALVVQALQARILQLVVPGLLLAVALYVVLSPRMDDTDAHQRLGTRGYAPVAGGIGFYDGFFGPGTGSFFTTSLVALRGFGLTRATAMTKLLNATSNWASL